MRVAFEDHDTISLVRLEGDFTFEHVDAFRRAVTDRIERGIRDFVLVVEGVEFIDSEGLETLLWLQDESATMLGQIRLVGCQPGLLTILEVVRLEQQFESCESTTGAVKSLR